jgi:hypothetical protein
MHELTSVVRCPDNFSARGRKRAKAHRPRLVDDMRAVVDDRSQTVLTFRTTRWHTRLSAAVVRRQLVAQKGHTADALPCVATISAKLSALVCAKYGKVVPKNGGSRRDLSATDRRAHGSAGRFAQAAPLVGCQSDDAYWRPLPRRHVPPGGLSHGSYRPLEKT